MHAFVPFYRAECFNHTHWVHIEGWNKFEKKISTVFLQQGDCCIQTRDRIISRRISDKFLDGWLKNLAECIAGCARTTPHNVDPLHFIYDTPGRHFTRALRVPTNTILKAFLQPLDPSPPATGDQHKSYFSSWGDLTSHTKRWQNVMSVKYGPNNFAKIPSFFTHVFHFQVPASCQRPNIQGDPKFTRLKKLRIGGFFNITSSYFENRKRKRLRILPIFQIYRIRGAEKYKLPLHFSQSAEEIDRKFCYAKIIIDKLTFSCLWSGT